MKSSFFSLHSQAPTPTKRRGFTLVEMLVALAVTTLLLSVIMVPLRLAFDALNTSRSKSEVQQAAQVTLRDLEQDLRRAIKVYPNSRIIGITDKAPYFPNNLGLPYTISTLTTDISGQAVAPNRLPVAGVCNVPALHASPTANAWSNPSRIDLVLPRLVDGSVASPVTPDRYMVSYYARRQDISKEFDPYDNPVVLFRAQYAVQDSAGNDYETSPGVLNAETGPSRFPTSTCGAQAATKNREAIWLAHNHYGEANLEPLCVDVAGVPTAHTLATPRGMALNLRTESLPALADGVKAWLQPDTSFVCKDSNKDGIIDSVTVNLGLVNYGAVGATTRNGRPVKQLERFSLSVDIPNAS